VPTKTPEPTVILFGNSAPVHQELQAGGSHVAVRHPYLKQTVTRVVMPSEVIDPAHAEHSLSTDNDRLLAMIGRSLKTDQKQYAVGLRELEDIIGEHCYGGAKPDWVVAGTENAKGEMDFDEKFMKSIGAHFAVDLGEPQNGLPNTGRDLIHTGYMTTCYMALTATTTAYSATDTTLAGEITTAGGGLIRGAVTFAHTTSTNTTTMTRTFTANGSDSLSVIIAKIGVFSASSGGTMMWETVLSSSATLTTSGDSLTATDTATIG
jgi:hypothetical protein